MKVFFIGTPRGDLDSAKLIHATISNLGYKQTSNFMVEIDPLTFYQTEEKDWQKRYFSRLEEIAKADVCIFEVSTHSISVGQLLQEAIRREKPVIALYSNEEPHFLLGTAGNENRLQLLKYTPQDLEDILKYAFETAEQLLTTRFTMLLSPEYSRFLDNLNKEKGISRSEYIRSLIREKMSKDM